MGRSAQVGVVRVACARSARLLASVGVAALSLAIATLPATAATYSVSNDAQFRQAIIDANTAGDTAAVIVLQGSGCTPTSPTT